MRHSGHAASWKHNLTNIQVSQSSRLSTILEVLHMKEVKRSRIKILHILASNATPFLSQFLVLTMVAAGEEAGRRATRSATRGGCGAYTYVRMQHAKR